MREQPAQSSHMQLTVCMCISKRQIKI